MDYQPDGKRAMKDSTAYMMTDMLKDVLNGGTGFNGAIPGLIQAAKTGTSNYTDEDLARMGTTEKELPRIVPLLVIQHTMPFLFGLDTMIEIHQSIKNTMELPRMFIVK